MDDCLSLLMRDSLLKMSEKDATYCYGLSKMTVEKENEHNKKYFELQFVELLEVIGRVAEFKYRGTTLNDAPLAEKIGYVLDLIIPPMLEVEKKEANIELVEESESDDDY